MEKCCFTPTMTRTPNSISGCCLSRVTTHPSHSCKHDCKRVKRASLRTADGSRTSPTVCLAVRVRVIDPRVDDGNNDIIGVSFAYSNRHVNHGVLPCLE